MRLHPARIVRSATIALAALGMTIPAVAQDAPADPESKADPPAPTVVRFDPGRMPEIEANTPALGWRFGRLSSQQTRVLRRGFKLPLDALVGAKSPQDLVQAAVVAPLPDPSQPMLAVDKSAAGSAAVGTDPFSGNGTKRTLFRDDPMRALGEWLGVTEGETADAFSASSDPFAADNTGGFDTGSGEESPDSATEGPDPFADEGDDPFADF